MSVMPFLSGAPPPKKNPGSAPDLFDKSSSLSQLGLFCNTPLIIDNHYNGLSVM